MDIFTALSVPTRRSVFELIATHGQISASDIYKNFSVSPPAISQHLHVLLDAGLVHVERDGQKRLYSINPGALMEIDTWVQQLIGTWTQRLDRLDKVIQEEKQKQ